MKEKSAFLLCGVRSRHQPWPGCYLPSPQYLDRTHRGEITGGLIFPWVSFFFFFAILNRFKGDWIKGGGWGGTMDYGIDGMLKPRMKRGKEEAA